MSAKLDAYTKAVQVRDKFMADNPALFAEFNSLEAQVAETESALKAEARELGDMDNGIFAVKVTIPYTKKFNLDLVYAEVDRDKLDLAVEQGLCAIVPESLSVKDYDKFTRFGRENGFSEVLQRAYSEEAGTPRVSIVKVKADSDGN